jgi:transcriptional regulator with XRE-family HTH domain
MAALPSQEELRRRLRAARVLCDLTIADLASRIDTEAGMGERVLRRLEAGESKLRPPALRELANAMEIPYAWFTVPSITTAVALVGSEPGEFEERLRRLEEWVASFPDNGDEAHPEDPPPSPGRRGPRGSRPTREP